MASLIWRLDRPGLPTKSKFRWISRFRVKCPTVGQQQTVGRTERHAALSPLQQRSDIVQVVSDLHSPVREGNEWSAKAESERGRHASR